MTEINQSNQCRIHPQVRAIQVVLYGFMVSDLWNTHEIRQALTVRSAVASYSSMWRISFEKPPGPICARTVDGGGSWYTQVRTHHMVTWMAWPLGSYFPLQTVGELHFHVSESECIDDD